MGKQNLPRKIFAGPLKKKTSNYYHWVLLHH